MGLRALLCLVLAGAWTGCERFSGERAAVQERKAAVAAIKAYSSATDDANRAHAAVVAAFSRANRASALPAYKAALRQEVLPALDGFVAALERMPTATPELARVHGALVDAYKAGRKDLAAFAEALQSRDDLGRFAQIRDALQEGFARYQRELAAYYERYRTRLKSADDEATSPPAGAATPTGA